MSDVERNLCHYPPFKAHTTHKLEPLTKQSPFSISQIKSQRFILILSDNVASLVREAVQIALNLNVKKVKEIQDNKCPMTNAIRGSNIVQGGGPQKKSRNTSVPTN